MPSSTLFIVLGIVAIILLLLYILRLLFRIRCYIYCIKILNIDLVDLARASAEKDPAAYRKMHLDRIQMRFTELMWALKRKIENTIDPKSMEIIEIRFCRGCWGPAALVTIGIDDDELFTAIIVKEETPQLYQDLFDITKVVLFLDSFRII